MGKIQTGRLPQLQIRFIKTKMKDFFNKKTRRYILF